MSEQLEQGKKVAKLIQVTRNDSPIRAEKWDEEFILSVSKQVAYKALSEKQMKVIDDLLTKYDTSNLPADYLQKFKQEQEEKQKLLQSDRELLNYIMELRLGLFDKRFMSSLCDWVGKERSLTVKQREAAIKVRDKYQARKSLNKQSNPIVNQEVVEKQ